VVRQSVPDEVEDAVLRALEKTPADRFQTMRDFSGALADAEADAAMQRTAARRAATGARRVPTRELRAPEPPASSRKRRPLMIGGGAALMLLIAGGAWAGLRHRSDRATPSALAGDLDPASIAVLYFKDLGGGDSLGYLADGLTEGLIRELGRVQGLSVISANGVAPFRSDSTPRDSVARSLKVGTLVQGGVEEAGGRIRVTVRLVDGASGVDFQRSSFELPGNNALAIQDSLTQQVADLIRQRLGSEIKVREERERTKSTDAWALLQRAGQHQKTAEALADKADSAGANREFSRADSLLAAAEPLDPTWIQPILGRTALAYRRSRLAGDEPLEAARWIELGLGHVKRALALNADNPDALELRGNLRYWRWLLSLEPDPRAARALLTAAREDLEKAVKENPTQAGAWATLSHLYYQTGNAVDVKLAAQRAYESDAYLSNANVVLSRLFYSSYDLAQFPDAVHWCDEGQRRFPGDYRFVECRLYLLTTKAREPDAALAWRLADSVVALAPEGEREYQGLNARMMIAATLARAGLADSARRLASAARGRPEIDPTRDLLYAEAFVRTLLGDTAAAIASLRVYLAANPEKRSAFADDPTWWFRPLTGTAGYRELVGNQ
jgi:serine/threonine-protein kinase